MVMVMIMIVVMMIVVIVIAVVRVMGHAGSMDGPAPLFNRPLPIDLRRPRRSNAAHESIVPV